MSCLLVSVHISFDTALVKGVTAPLSKRGQSMAAAAVLLLSGTM
jgi:hypothetical protein